jgi:FkbM family methyltransferase
MLKKIAKEILPPFVHSMLKRIVKRENKPYHPSWHTINSGILQGRQLFLDLRDGLWQEEMIEGRYDRFIFDYLSSLNLQGKTVFEIGAQIGFHAMHFAALVGEEGFVYAFEPNRFNRERMDIILEKNPDLAKRIRIFNVALSDKSGHEDFYFSKDVDSGASSGSFIANAHTYYPKNQEFLALFEKITVETVALDDIASTIGAGIVPHVMKIDVEGAESSVLQGGVELLKKHRPLILIEVHSIYNMLKTYDILKSVHYNVDLLKEEPDGRCFIVGKSQTEEMS